MAVSIDTKNPPRLQKGDRLTHPIILRWSKIVHVLLGRRKRNLLEKMERRRLFRLKPQLQMIGNPI